MTGEAAWSPHSGVRLCGASLSIIKKEGSGKKSLRVRPSLLSLRTNSEYHRSTAQVEADFLCGLGWGPPRNKAGRVQGRCC